jgi:acyl-homoserine lactone synthase
MRDQFSPSQPGGLDMIYVISGNETTNYPTLMNQVYRLRHDVFVGELGWSDLHSDTGLEQDQFDHPEAVHHVCVRDDKVVGYQRMLPTIQPHLLSDVFPELCVGTPPSGHNIYELTRYCVAPAYREGRRGVSSVGSELMAGFVEWGIDSDVDNVIIEFETTWVLRALQLKFLVHPLGFETQIGKQKIVATKLTFDSNTLIALRNYRGHHAPVITYASNHEQYLAIAS